jgi:hypothetical protein
VTLVPLAVLFALVPFHPPYWVLPPLTVGIAFLFVVVVLGTRSLARGDRLLLEAAEQFFGRPLPIVRSVVRWVMGPAITRL